MAEIAAKFGAAMTGFWWSLDDNERRMIFLAGVWVAVSLLGLADDRRRRRELNDLLAELDRRDAAAR